MTEYQRTILASMEGHGWLRPMDVGGRDGSGHATMLRRMVDKEWVERERRDSATGSRASYLYRLTPKGRLALHNANATVELERLRDRDA